MAAAARDGVLGRRALYAVGVTRWQIAAEVRAGRWSRGGRQAVVVAPGDARRRGWQVALLEVGGRGALAGVTALQAAGLDGVETSLCHVIVPKSSRPRRPQGVLVHESRRFREDEVLRGELDRVAPAVAAVQAGMWAVSDRQAAFFLTIAVQQRLCTVQDLAAAMEVVRRHRRRRLLLAVVADVAVGAQSMGELDFARLCRRSGLPEPDRQVVHRLPQGTAVLDVEWRAYRVVAEIDGVQHLQVAAVVADALRDNEMRLRGVTVLRIPVLALRTDPAPFLAQVRRALQQGGWVAAA